MVACLVCKNDRICLSKGFARCWMFSGIMKFGCSSIICLAGGHVLQVMSVRAPSSEERRHCLSHIVLTTDIALCQKISNFLRFKSFFVLIILPLFFYKVNFFTIPSPFGCIANNFHEGRLYNLNTIS